MQSHYYSPHSFPKPFPIASSSSYIFRSNTIFTLQSSSFSTSLLSSPPLRCNLNLPPRILRDTKGFATSSDDSTADNSDCGCQLATPIVSSDADSGSIGIVKFMLFFAFLTLRDSYPAAAASDFATGLNSIPIFGDVGDLSTGFASAFLLIFFSELGDKTFFIAALLAARNSAGVVFVGTFGALAAMTVISVALGRTFHYVDELLPFRCTLGSLPCWMPRLVIAKNQMTNRRSSRCFLCNGSYLNQAELAVSEFSGNGAGIVAAASTIASTFLLVFVAEWGDKSFFSTIALAAASSPLGVIAGSLAGHGVATLVAVLGGTLLGTFLSEKVIAYIGGVLFLVFAAVTVFEIVQ